MVTVPVKPVMLGWTVVLVTKTIIAAALIIFVCQPASLGYRAVKTRSAHVLMGMSNQIAAEICSCLDGYEQLDCCECADGYFRSGATCSGRSLKLCV